GLAGALLTSSVVPRDRRPPRTTCVVRWQVFGLAGVATGRLLAIASQADQAQCLMMAFVPAHRCGAVPVSHRVPSYLRGPGWAAEPATGTTIYRFPGGSNSHMSCRRVAHTMTRPGRTKPSGHATRVQPAAEREGR